MAEKTKRKPNSKYLREYGATIQQMSARYNCTYYRIWSLHLEGKLHAFIEEQGKKEKVETK